MDKLWAPWRVKYVKRIPDQQKKCIFCHMQKEKKDKKNHIFMRSEYAFAVLNIYPYNSGHILVVPYRHVNDLSKLHKEERDNLLDVLEISQKLLDKTLKPKGYNIGINLGRVAGAGIPGHLHIHLVPRWPGDVNFMPVSAQTKVISQHLAALYEHLKKAHKNL